MTPPNEEKGSEVPMGVSQWLEHGKKYGYDTYFIDQAKEEGRKEGKIQGLIEGTKTGVERGIKIGREEMARAGREAMEKAVDERQLDNGLPDSFRGWNNARAKALAAFDQAVKDLTAKD